jgi:Fe-S oxidoreductase
MAFIAVIPFSKLKHIFTTSLNYVFSDLRPKGTITTLDLENPDAEQFGVVKVKDLTWKDIFDADACTRCGRCEDRCPAWNAGKPLSPMSVIQQIGNAAFSRNDGSLIDLVSEEALWACTTCFACDDVCPANIEVVGKIVDMRRYLTLMEGKFPGKEVRTAIDNIEVNSNPFGFAFASRGDWANGLPVERIAGGAEVDVLYFVGCYASFDQRNREVARSFVEICAAAGIRVGILGREEKCCGEPVRKLGNEYLYQTLARENIDRFLSCGVRKIVTTCPHCFHTLSHDYRELGLQADVEHYTTFIERLVSRGILHLAQERFSCTYHDSCYLGRYNDILDPPRHVLRAAGAQITEMRQCGKDSACCGAGGARVLMEETVDQRINVNRIRMAKETQAPLLVSNCPFCLTMFNDATKAGSGETPIQVRDLAEVVAERIKSTVVNPKSEYEITRVHQTGSGHELEVSGS